MPDWTAHQGADGGDSQAVGRVTERRRDDEEGEGDDDRLQGTPGRCTCPAPVPPDEDGQERADEGHPEAAYAPDRVGHLVVGPDHQQILWAVARAHVPRLGEEPRKQRNAHGIAVDEPNQ